MKFAIAGVSGNTGKVAAEALLAGGHQVRVIVRDAAKGAAWKQRGAEVAVADLADDKALTEALRGVDGAYLLVPPAFGAESYLAHQTQVVDTFEKAIAENGVPHVVLLSSVGAHLPEKTGPIKGLHRAEARLGALPKTRLTFLRAAYFIENFAGSLAQLGEGVFPTFVAADFAFDTVATRDIGAVAAGLLAEGAPAKNQIVELSGPKVSARDVARALSEIVGKPVTVAEAPIGILGGILEGAGFSKDLAALYVEMTEGLGASRIVFEGNHRTAKGTTTVRQVLEPIVTGKR
ncbi:MAG: NmrA family NAD(P)-binding protein [Polyangiaceae bacterium]|nr:NmrA family NAD(P)-binding protein [Polyangiaceae bacterium]